MALEDRIAAAQHFRNAGFRNLDIGALFIAQALDRIADALEARTGADAPDSAPTPTQEPPAAPSAAQDASRAPQGGWITHRAPEEADADQYKAVLVPWRHHDAISGLHYLQVHPGTPWAPVGSNPGPWDPTSLDRKGWIRSRLPTALEANETGFVKVPALGGWMKGDFIVLGQPWAPFNSQPAPYTPLIRSTCASVPLWS